jgi:hypothetical protein
MRSRKAATSPPGWGSSPGRSRPATAPYSARYRNAQSLPAGLVRAGGMGCANHAQELAAATASSRGSKRPRSGCITTSSPSRSPTGSLAPPRHYARKMCSRASTSLAPGGLSPEYSMDWPKLRSSTAHCRNCIATSRAEALRARRRQPQTKGQKSVASCKGSHCTQQCCNLPTALHSLRRVTAVL